MFGILVSLWQVVCGLFLLCLLYLERQWLLQCLNFAIISNFYMGQMVLWVKFLFSFFLLLCKLEGLSLKPKHINQTLGMTTHMFVSSSLGGECGMTWSSLRFAICQLILRISERPHFKEIRRQMMKQMPSNLCWPFIHIYTLSKYILFLTHMYIGIFFKRVKMHG